MTAEHGSAGENLLEQIASTEQQLEQKVTQAKEDARRIVDEARTGTEALHAAARREADDLMSRTHTEIARETDAITSQRLTDAEAEAKRVRTQAADRMPPAVEMVVRRVLKGLE